MENIPDPHRILKKSKLSVADEKPDCPYCNEGMAKSVKFYVTIPISDVGVIVLEQAVTIDNGENGEIE